MSLLLEEMQNKVTIYYFICITLESIRTLDKRLEATVSLFIAGISANCFGKHQNYLAKQKMQISYS